MMLLLWRNASTMALYWFWEYFFGSMFEAVRKLSRVAMMDRSTSAYETDMEAKATISEIIKRILPYFSAFLEPYNRPARLKFARAWGYSICISSISSSVFLRSEVCPTGHLQVILLKP